MPSLLVEEQQFKTEPAVKQAPPQQQLYLDKQEQPPLPTTSTMGSVTALGLTDQTLKQHPHPPPHQLFYETFLESISNEIVQYLSTRKQHEDKTSSPSPNTGSGHHRKRSSTGRPDKPHGIDRKRHKHNDRVSK